jgi:hypothetical protein
MEKFTIHPGHIVAHGHSGTLGRGLAAGPKTVAFGQPTTHGARPARAYHACGARSSWPSAASAHSVVRHGALQRGGLLAMRFSANHPHYSNYTPLH